MKKFLRYFSLALALFGITLILIAYFSNLTFISLLKTLIVTSKAEIGVKQALIGLLLIILAFIILIISFRVSEKKAKQDEDVK